MIEGNIIYQNQGLDKNFIISLIPLCTSIFIYLLKIKFSTSKTVILRTLGKYIYWFHLIPIELLNWFFKDQISTSNIYFGRIKFFLGILIPIIFSLIFKHYINKTKKTGEDNF